MENTPRRDAYDLVIIGSGIAGLVSAGMVAKTGKSVLVLEQHDAPGGNAHHFKRGSYIFDPAVHLIGDETLFDSLLRHLGARDAVRFLPIDHFYRTVMPGFQLDVPIGRGPYVQAYVDRFPEHAEPLRRYFELCARVHREAHDMPEKAGIVGLDALADSFPTLFRYHKANLAEVLDEHFTDARVRAAVAAPCVWLGLPPSRVSFLTLAQLIFSHVDGVFVCEGGVQALVDAFVLGLQRNGGEIVLGKKVERILLDGGRAVGVRLQDGTDVKGGLIMSNADARQTYEKLVGFEHLPAQFVKNFLRLKHSLSAFVYFGATRLDLDALAAPHQIFSLTSWDHEETFRRILRPEPAALFVTTPTRVDKGLAPAGEHLVVAVAAVPFDVSGTWKEIKPGFAKSMVEGIDGLFPGFSREITFEESATPLTMERYSLTYKGAIYSWEQSPQQVAVRRPAHRTPIPGLFLTGQWTSSGGGFLRATLSGLKTAQMYMTDTGLPDIIQDFRGRPPG
jgi:prolycopene isomerase